MGREPLFLRIAPLTPLPCGTVVLCGISTCFQVLSPSGRQVVHALLTRSPLTRPRRASSVRLACVRHAASVRPEPGSNSWVQSITAFAVWFFLFTLGRLNQLRSRCSKLLESTGLYFLVALYSFQGALRSFLATAFVSYISFFVLSTPFFIFLKIIFESHFWGASGSRFPPEADWLAL